MPTVSLAARNIATLRSNDGARGEYWDASLPGFGLRVTVTGVRTWTIRYRHQGRLCRMTLGRYPTLSLADAREAARTALRRAGLGDHPAGQKQVARARHKDTVLALVEEYEKHASTKRSWREERRTLYADVLPAWRNRLVRDISRRDVRDLVEAKAQRAPIMANRLLAYVSHLFSFALEREWIAAHPAHRMTKPTKERSRDRVLNDDELRQLWQALHETEANDEHGQPRNRLTPALNDALLVMLQTAQRCGEVCRMRWEDVDLDTGWWRIPGTATKNGTDHRVPLTDPVVDLLGGRLQVAKADADFVFSTRKGTSVATRARKAAPRLSKGLSFSFRAHDLRRTAASGMAQAGVPRDHIAHVLNHRSVTHATVTAIYDRYTYDREKRVALECWGRSILAIVTSQKPSHVIPFSTAR